MIRSALVLGVALLTLAGSSYTQSDSARPSRSSISSTDPIDCTVLRPNATTELRTLPIIDPASHTAAYATVTVTRSSGEAEIKCAVTYRFFVQPDRRPAREVKRFDDSRSGILGVSVVGFSPNSAFVAADFWWAEGDYTAVRPVIHSLRTGATYMPDLADRITTQLPSCDYNQYFTRLTDSGEAVIHVPRSHYVEHGCPDQGEWALHPKTARLRRLSR